MSLQWNGDAVVAILRAELAARLEVQARTLTNYAKKQMSREHAVQAVSTAATRRKRAERRLARSMGFRGRVPRDIQATIREMAGSLGLGGRRRYLDPSKPGEYPKKATGFLRAHIIHDADPAALTAYWGLAADPQAIYGKHLELGTSRMGRRPWMSRANLECRAALKAIMEKPLRSLAGTPLAGIGPDTAFRMVTGGGPPNA